MCCLIILIDEKKSDLGHTELTKISRQLEHRFYFQPDFPWKWLIKERLTAVVSNDSFCALSPRESFNWNCMLGSHSKSSVNTLTLKNLKRVCSCIPGALNTPALLCWPQASLISHQFLCCKLKDGRIKKKNYANSTPLCL